MDVLDRLRQRYTTAWSLTGERDVPILRLIEDLDPRFRPCPRLLEVIDAADRDPSCLRPVYSLDRPIVPLLNALFSLGLTTTTSCAGHDLDDTPSPHVALRDPTSRGLAAFRLTARTLPHALIENWIYVRQGVQREGLVLRWGARLLSGQTGFTAARLEQLDRLALEATERLRAEVGLPADGVPTPEIEFMRALVRRQRTDCVDLSLSISERDRLLRLHVATWGKGRAVPKSLLERSGASLDELRKLVE